MPWAGVARGRLEPACGGNQGDFAGDQANPFSSESLLARVLLLTVYQW